MIQNIHIKFVSDLPLHTKTLAQTILRLEVIAIIGNFYELSSILIIKSTIRSFFTCVDRTRNSQEICVEKISRIRELWKGSGTWLWLVAALHGGGVEEMVLAEGFKSKGRGNFPWL